MTADELRELAQKIEEKWWRWKDSPTIELKAASYIRACADALEKGPVAWAATDETGKIVEALGMNGTRRFSDPLYLRAMPGALRLPEPMTDDDVHRVSGAQRDAMLDHIYEYGTGAEGVMQRVTQLARAIEAETLRRVKEANK